MHGFWSELVGVVGIVLASLPPLVATMTRQLRTPTASTAVAFAAAVLGGAVLLVGGYPLWFAAATMTMSMVVFAMARRRLDEPVRPAFPEHVARSGLSSHEERQFREIVARYDQDRLS